MNVRVTEWVDTCYKFAGLLHNDTKPCEIIIENNDKCMKITIAYDVDGVAYLVYGTP